MRSQLGAPFDPNPPWGYADQRLAPMGPPGPTVDLSQVPPPPSQGPRVITIFEVAPQQGYEGTPIRITCDLHFPPTPDSTGNRIRLMFGMLAIETSVQAPISNNDNYIVSAIAPSLQAAGLRGSTAWSVPVVLEAITEPYGVVERANLGEFHFLGDASAGTPKRARKKLEDSPGHKPPVAARAPMRRRRDDELFPAMPAAGGPTSFVYDSPPTPPQPGLVRTTQLLPNAPATNPYLQRIKARLEIEGDLNTMRSNWSQTMFDNQRCLVQFTRRQEGHVVRASFKPVEEKDWTPNMIVISCLWHQARGDCYFTSVDAIYLLECLMGTRYTTEEKNRIRRNLESFKPTTLQKNEGQWQDFYAHIMNYPNPKPRNIDKGLKVFPWVHLEQALKKIFANYSAYVNMPFNFNVNADPHASTHVAYGHQPHPSQDSITYADDRSGHHQAHASVGSVDELAAYIDMSPVTNPTPPYGHRAATSSGGSASATSELVTPPFPPPNPDSEFNSYVSMSPSVAQTIPRDPSVAQLGLYVPNVSDPNVVGGIPDSRSAPGAVPAFGGLAGRASTSDVRVGQRPSTSEQYP